MWEKEKLLVTSNFSFSHIFFKRLVLQTWKNQGLFGKGLNKIWVVSPLHEKVDYVGKISERPKYYRFPLVGKYCWKEVKKKTLDETRNKNTFIPVFSDSKHWAYPQTGVLTHDHKMMHFDALKGGLSDLGTKILQKY